MAIFSDRRIIWTNWTALLYPFGYNTDRCYTRSVIKTIVFPAQQGRICSLHGIIIPDRDYIMSLSNDIKDMRRSAGLSQVELAQRTCVGLRFVRDLEQGKPTVRLDKVNQVLAIFGYELQIGKKS